MNEDKVLRKALSQTEAQLPDGFHARVMERIHQVAEYRDKRNYAAGIVLAAVVSLSLVSGAVYLLAMYSDFSFTRLFSAINFQFLTGPAADLYLMTDPSLVYYACFALIVIVLLTIDLLLRQTMGRMN
jgi:hypothetical protein